MLSIYEQQKMTKTTKSGSGRNMKKANVKNKVINKCNRQYQTLNYMYQVYEMKDKTKIKKISSLRSVWDLILRVIIVQRDISQKDMWPNMSSSYRKVLIKIIISWFLQPNTKELCFLFLTSNIWYITHFRNKITLQILFQKLLIP